MSLVPHAIRRTVAGQATLAKKNAPTLLFGAGVVSMVGSTVLACNATLKVESVLKEIDQNMEKAHQAKIKVEAKDKAMAHNATASVDDQVDLGDVPAHVTYTDREMKQDIVIIYVRGAAKIIKLYAPAVILGGVGVACLTRSHQILKERNTALAAAYFAVNQAFEVYRERVVEKYGEETDREFRYGVEEITIIDEDTGKTLDTVRVDPGEPSGYARWFDDTNPNWSPPNQMAYNWIFLRNQQNWANDMLRSRGHLFLNEAYSLCGLSHTSAGAIVGWVWDPRNDKHDGDNLADFGCWDDDGRGYQFFEGINGREGAILLDFNVDGPIWDLIDELNAKDTGR